MTRCKSAALTQESRLADAEHDLWECFHRGSNQVIKVPREALALCLSNSKMESGRVLAGPPSPRVKLVNVTRSGLWELLTGKPHIRQAWNRA